MGYYNWEEILSRKTDNELLIIIRNRNIENQEKVEAAINEASKRKIYKVKSESSFQDSTELKEPSNTSSTKEPIDSIFEEQNHFIQKHKIFHNNNETLIDTLGSGFISSLFVQENFSKSVLFCSNKRVYQRGKLFDRNFQGKITYYNGERSVDLREITGLTFYVEDPIHRFKLIAPAFIFGIIGFLIAAGQRGDIKVIISVISGVLIGLGIVLLIIYGLKKGKWFVIEYAGGMIMTNCNWYSKKSIKRFMKNVSIQKDKLFE